MPHTPRTKNRSYFHYRVIKENEEGQVELDKYFMTMEDIRNEFGISRHSVSYLLKNPDAKSRKYKGLRVIKDYKEAMIVVPVPQQEIQVA
jgi:transcriptional antiterminator